MTSVAVCVLIPNNSLADSITVFVPRKVIFSCVYFEEVNFAPTAADPCITYG